jgi:hypothetical protein
MIKKSPVNNVEQAAENFLSDSSNNSGVTSQFLLRFIGGSRLVPCGYTSGLLKTATTQKIQLQF